MILLQASLNRDLSDDADLDRHGSTGQQLQTLGTDEAPSITIGTSTSSIKLKSKNTILFYFILFNKIEDTRPRTGSLLGGGDDHSLYTHQEETLYVDLTLVRLGLLRLNFMMESCPPGSLPDPQFLNSLLLLVCLLFFFGNLSS
jgi:hypothetical protein